MTFSRLQTSQSRLQIPWQATPGENFYGIETLAAAIEHLSQNGGGKPLLINRETEVRDPKVAKLHKEALASERFSLASHWFHCIKVGDEVLAEHHPLNPLFAGKNPAAIVLLSPDGKKQVSFLGTVQQRVTWTAIAGVLASAYEKDATNAVKELEKLLCTYDKIDGEVNELNAQIARAEKRQDQKKVAAVQNKLKAVEEQRQKAIAQEEELRKLVLRGAAAEVGAVGDGGN
jgi:hypothetical protein